MSIDNRNETDEEIHRRRMKRIEQMKAQKQAAMERQKKIMMGIVIGVVVLIIIVIIALLAGHNGKDKDSKPEESSFEPIPVVREDIGETVPVSTPAPTPEPAGYQPLTAQTTSATKGFSDAVNSTYAILIDVDQKTILGNRNGKDRMCPASMTKLLTVYTAAKALGLTEDNRQDAAVLKEKFTMTIDITDYCFVNDCSNVGFLVDEQIPIVDLFYGTIMPSGADAALGLANYVAGSHEAFVDMMNAELKDLGIAETSHFTNCIGLYDDNLYSTAYDMAVILKAAMDVPFLREVLGVRRYKTIATEQHPDGIDLSNLFLRRIEDRDTHSEIIGAKTGYVVQSKSCSASMALTADGREYICVTGGADSKWKCIYDHVEIYTQWIPASN